MEGLERPAEPAVRDGRGRFVPGQSGNPAGKRPGTRNHASRLREVLEDGEAAKAARVLIDRALAGNVPAARFLVDRVFPKARGREIDLGVAPPEQGGSLEAMFDAALWAMAAGDITPDEASLIARLIEHRRDSFAASAPAHAADTVAVDAPAAAPSPAFHLQTAGRAGEAAPAAPPLNRHQRRMRAALLRASSSGATRPPLAAAAP